MSLRCKDGTLAELGGRLGIERMCALSVVAVTFIVVDSPEDL